MQTQVNGDKGVIEMFENDNGNKKHFLKTFKAPIVDSILLTRRRLNRSVKKKKKNKKKKNNKKK